MKRHLVLPAAVLVVGVLLGATVLRTDVAAATSLAQSVFVNNTTADPVPVVEQNLDKNNGAIRVHEQGVVPTRQAGQPFSITLAYPDSYTVPVGEQLNIRYVNGVTGGCLLDIPEQIAVGGTGYYFPIRPVGGGLSGGGIVSETVDINAAGGTQITDEGPCRLTLSGWLVP